MRNHLILGKWNAICDVCGLKFKNTDLRKNWKGLMVCPQDFEYRNQQDFIKIRAEDGSPPWTRPQGTDQFVEACDIWTSSPMADYGTADCMLVGGNTSIPVLINVFGASSVAGRAIASRSISGITP